MKSQNNSKSAVIISTIGGKISSIIGWVVTVFFALIIIFGITSPDEVGKTAGLILSFIFLIIGILNIRVGIKTKKRIRRFKKYITIISVEKTNSIENIAAATSQSVDFVINDIKVMINKKYFANAYIDLNSKEIVFRNKPMKAEENVNKETMSVEYVIVTCNGCGATNKLIKGQHGECEFCGSPIIGK